MDTRAVPAHAASNSLANAPANAPAKLPLATVLATAARPARAHVDIHLHADLRPMLPASHPLSQVDVALAHASSRASDLAECPLCVLVIACFFPLPSRPCTPCKEGAGANPVFAPCRATHRCVYSCAQHTAGPGARLRFFGLHATRTRASSRSLDKECARRGR